MKLCMVVFGLSHDSMYDFRKRIKVCMVKGLLYGDMCCIGLYDDCMQYI